MTREQPGDVAGLGGDLEPAHRAVAFGADRNVVEKHMADEPGPGFADEAEVVVVLVEVELARWWPGSALGRLGHDFATELRV